MSEKIQPKKFSKSPLKLVTEYKQTDVITGANLFISLADARALYKLTEFELTGNDISRVNDREAKGAICRDILRKISKSILLLKGDFTDEEVLMDKFNNL